MDKILRPPVTRSVESNRIEIIRSYLRTKRTLPLVAVVLLASHTYTQLSLSLSLLRDFALTHLCCDLFQSVLVAITHHELFFFILILMIKVVVVCLFVVVAVSLVLCGTPTQTFHPSSTLSFQGTLPIRLVVDSLGVLVGTNTYQQLPSLPMGGGTARITSTSKTTTTTARVPPKDSLQRIETRNHSNPTISFPRLAPP